MLHRQLSRCSACTVPKLRRQYLPYVFVCERKAQTGEWKASAFLRRWMATSALLCLLLLVISPSAGARGCHRDGEQNCLAYEEVKLLLAYEMTSLINGLQGSLGFCKRRGLRWASIGQLLPLSRSLQIYFGKLSEKYLHLRKTTPALFPACFNL